MNERLDRVARGPHVISRISKEVLQRDTPLLSSVLIELILDEEKYSLSPRQNEVFMQTVGAFEDHKKTATAALLMYRGNPDEFTAIVAKRLECSPESICEVLFYPTSVAVKVDSKTFRTVWNNTLGKEDKVTDDKEVPAIGFVDTDFLLYVDGGTVPFSLVDFSSAGAWTSKHEDTHIQYGYLHPRWLTREPQEKDEDVKSTHDLAVEAVRANDKAAFSRVVKSAMDSHLHAYLNELASKAIERQGAYRYFWSDKSWYYRRIQESIKEVERALNLPQAFQDILPWKAIIYREREVLKQRMRYIEDRYEKLADSDISTDELLSIVQFLTPDQGYLISYFVNGKLTVEDLRGWVVPERSPKGRKRVAYWSDFVLEYSRFRIDVYALVLIDEVKTLERTHDRFRGDNPDTALKNHRKEVEEIVEKLKDIVITRGVVLQDIFSNSLWGDKGIDEATKQAIVSRCLLKTIDFHEELHSFYETFLTVGHSPEMKEAYAAAAAYVSERMLSLIDAAEEITEAISKGEKPDYNALFAPGFTKNDEKRMRTLAAIEQGAPLIPILRDFPLEGEAVGYIMFRKGEVERAEWAERKKFNRKAISLLVRTLLWAKEKGLPEEEYKKTREYLAELKADDCVPRQYHSIVDKLLS